MFGPRKLKDAFNRAAIIPFETAIGLLSIVSSTAGMFHFGIIDPVTSTLPYWEAILVNLAYILSGIGMTAGILADLGSVEAFGLWLLSGSVIVRFVLYGRVLGYGTSFIVTGALDSLFLGAAMIRLYHIRKRHVIIKTSNDTNSLDLGL